MATKNQFNCDYCYANLKPGDYYHHHHGCRYCNPTYVCSLKRYAFANKLIEVNKMYRNINDQDLCGYCHIFPRDPWLSPECIHCAEKRQNKQADADIKRYNDNRCERCKKEPATDRELSFADDPPNWCNKCIDDIELQYRRETEPECFIEEDCHVEFHMEMHKIDKQMKAPFIVAEGDEWGDYY
jgi:hypothetical protein